MRGTKAGGASAIAAESTIMAKSAISTTDQGLLAWATNFHTVALAGPSTVFGISSTQLTAFNGFLTTYQTKLAACDPGVRNKSAVAGKNSAKKDLLDNARLLSSIVQGQSNVSDEQKIELGLSVRAHPTPIPPPSVPPQVDVKSVNGRTVFIRLHNSETGKRARPAGCKGASVYSFIGATPPTDPALFQFQGNTNLTTTSVLFPSSVAAGTTVWITAAWYNEKSQPGPAAMPVKAVIQYGMDSVAA